VILVARRAVLVGACVWVLWCHSSLRTVDAARPGRHVVVVAGVVVGAVGRPGLLAPRSGTAACS
jgi:hypothetical protein